MTKVQTKKQVDAARAKLHRRQLIVYFYTGILPGDHTPHYQFATSSATITPKTIFVHEQKGHRS